MVGEHICDSRRRCAAPGAPRRRSRCWPPPLWSARAARPRPPTGATAQPDPSTVNLGYLVNLTHAPALIGVSQGFFQGAMPKGTTVKTTTFSAGPAESEALLGGSLDAAFVGPGPAINAFIKTKGKVLIVAGTASGGAGLVVSKTIADGNFPADLAGKTLSSPQLGNTQDIAAAHLAGDQGAGHQHQRRRPGDHRLELGQLGEPAELRSRQDRRRLGSRALRIGVHPPGQGHARR